MRIIGYDGSGIPRVFGATVEEAKEEARAYVERRPDTKPLDDWRFGADASFEKAAYGRTETEDCVGRQSAAQFYRARS